MGYGHKAKICFLFIGFVFHNTTPTAQINNNNKTKKANSSMRSCGGQRKCYEDILMVSLKSSGLDPETWEADAQHRSNCRCLSFPLAIQHCKRCDLHCIWTDHTSSRGELCETSSLS